MKEKDGTGLKFFINGDVQWHWLPLIKQPPVAPAVLP